MWKKLLFLAVLFYVLTPGVLVTLRVPFLGLSSAVVHAGVFALVYSFAWKAIKGKLGK